MADWSKYRVSSPTNKWDKYKLASTPDIPESPRLPELPSPFRKLPASQPTVKVGWTPFDSDSSGLQERVGNTIRPFTENFIDPLESKIEDLRTPLGVAGAIAGAAGFGVFKGLKNTGKKVATKVAETVTDALPEIKTIPGMRRLGTSVIDDPAKLLGPATNPEIIPTIPKSEPRFIVGQRGTTFDNSNYIPYTAQNQDFDALDRAMKGIDDAVNPRVSADLAADYGAPGVTRVIDPIDAKRDAAFKQVYDNLITRGYKPADAFNEAQRRSMEAFPHTKNPNVPVGEQGPYVKDTVADNPLRTNPIYSGPMRATVEPPVPGKKPELPKVEEPFVSNYPKTGPVRTVTDPKGKEAKKVLKDVNKITKAVTKNPETAEIVKYPEAIEKATKRMGHWRMFTKNSVRAIESELRTLGPAGKQLSDMLATASAKARQRASIWDSPYDEIKKILNKDEVEEFWKGVNEGIPSTNPKVQSAIDTARKVDEQRAASMQVSGLKNPETGEAVTPMKNYGPRIYPEGFWEDPKKIFSALKQRFPNLADDVAESIALGKSNPDIIDRIMKSANVDRNTADLILKLGKERGERAVASQYSRTLDLPGYRRDIDAFKEHNWDIAKRTAESETFGQLDMADPNSPMGKLIAQTNNPRYAEDLLKVALNREDWGRPAKAMQKVNKFASEVSAAMYLSMFPISNMSGLLPTVVRGGVKNTAKALLDVIAINRGATRAFATESGALYNITKGIIEHAGRGPIAKGVSMAENFNRTVSAAVGKTASQDLFETLLSGKIRPGDRQLLEDLTLTPIDELLKQKALTTQQIRNAGGRMAELTQGLGESRKVPIYWNNPYLQIPLIFKKYAFQSTGQLRDAVFSGGDKIEIAKKLAVLAAGSQVFGELTGDTKAAVRGGVKGAIKGDLSEVGDTIVERGQYLGKYGVENKVAQRIIDNVLQSWALGLVGDLFFMSTGRAQDIAYELSGPFTGTILTGAEATTKALTGNPEMLGREAIKRVPYVGPGAAEALLPTRYQQNRDKALPIVRPPK